MSTGVLIPCPAGGACGFSAHRQGSAAYQQCSGRSSSGRPAAGSARRSINLTAPPEKTSLQQKSLLRWDAFQKSHPKLSSMVLQVGQLNEAEVGALQAAAAVDFGEAGANVARVTEAEERAKQAIGTGDLRDILRYAIDVQDDEARANPNEDMYESSAILAANNALVAVVARETGNLSDDDYDALVRPWASIDASIMREGSGAPPGTAPQ